MEIVLFSYGFSEEKGYQVKSEDRRGILEMGCLKIDIVTIRRLAATMSHNTSFFFTSPEISIGRGNKSSAGTDIPFKHLSRAGKSVSKSSLDVFKLFIFPFLKRARSWGLVRL
jgi:hypothetical protein